MKRLAIVAAVTAVAALLVPSVSSAGPWKKVATLRGSGAKVVTTRLPSGPLVFVASHRGSSNFVVELRGPNGEELLVNEIGSWSGGTVGDTKAGRHRLVVKADGAWTIHVSRPTMASLKRLPGTFAGKGSTVIRVRSSRDQEMVVTGANTGDSNFIVYLVGYGSLSGQELVFNEIGPYSGEDLVDVPEGTLLLWVRAKGKWALKFAP